MRTAERHRIIVQRLRHQGEATVASLAEDLATSEVTVRRDLAELEELGVLRRTHGGARNLLLRDEEVPYRFRMLTAAAEKERIAARAAQMIGDGEVVAVDSGTTCLFVARALAGRNITVLPLSVQQVPVLCWSDSVRLLMPGGEVRASEGAVIGPVAVRTVEQYRFDTFVMSCCGVSAESGVTAFDVQDAAVKRAAAHASSRTLAVADASKLSITAMAHALDVDQVAALVTDESAPREPVRRLRSRGVDVVEV